MRHRCDRFQLGRKSGHRDALVVNMSVSLFRHGSIKTTLAKAKFMRSRIEKMITYAKNAKNKDILHVRRVLLSRLGGDAAIVEKLLSGIALKCKDRNGGYLRILKIGFRKGDDAEMSILQLVD